MWDSDLWVMWLKDRAKGQNRRYWKKNGDIGRIYKNSFDNG
jgi:hypothetical protein